MGETESVMNSSLTAVLLLVKILLDSQVFFFELSHNQRRGVESCCNLPNVLRRHSIFSGDAAIDSKKTLHPAQVEKKEWCYGDRDTSAIDDLWRRWTDWCDGTAKKRSESMTNISIKLAEAR